MVQNVMQMVLLLPHVLSTGIHAILLSCVPCCKGHPLFCSKRCDCAVACDTHSLQCCLGTDGVTAIVTKSPAILLVCVQTEER